MVNRRELLKSAGALGLGSTLPSGWLHGASDNTATHQVGTAVASAHRAFSSSFTSIPNRLGPTVVEFDRALPSTLSGTLYRNGPALMQRGDRNYHHWFDGDGMVQSFRFSDKSLTHRASMVQTDRFKQEEMAGQFLWSGFGTSFSDARSTQRPDDLNVGNISVLPLEDELLALWEAGSAWSLDPDTLETNGRKVFSEDSDGMSFSAHPKVDPDGRIWNFGYFSGSNKLALYDLKPSGDLNRIRLIDTVNANMVHDFAITSKYLVFVLMPITFKENGSDPTLAFADLLGWDASGSNHIVVIDKESLSEVQRYEVSPFFAFHFGNAWEDGDNIHIEMATTEPLSEFNNSVMRATQGIALPNGESYGQTQTPVIEITLDTRHRRVSIAELPILGADFPSFDQRYQGEPTQYLSLMSRTASLSPEVFGFNQIESFDRHSGSIKKWSYGDDDIAEEHIFIPKQNAPEGSGWLIGTVFNWHRMQTRLTVLNAQAIDDGPIAEAELPYHLPLGFHGKFVSDYAEG